MNIICQHRILLLFIVFIARGVALFGFELPPWELSSGYSGLIYQNVFSLQMHSALELAAATSIGDHALLQLGYRQGMDQLRGEAFTRICATRQVKRWQPEVGLELGITGRDTFTYDKKLLQEMNEASNEVKSPLYLAWVASPLAFDIGKGYRLKAFDLQIGTHLNHPGRTMRVQIGIINLGRKM